MHLDTIKRAPKIPISDRLTINDVEPSSSLGFFSYLRACLHGGGGPQVGEVTRLGEVKK